MRLCGARLLMLIEQQVVLRVWVGFRLCSSPAADADVDGKLYLESELASDCGVLTC